MRSYRYGCPHCRNPFAVEEDAVGRLVACPLCAETVQIPEADSVAGRDVLPRASPHDPRWPPELEPAADADLPGDKAGHPPSSVSPTTSVATGSQRGGPSPDLPDPMAPVAREHLPIQRKSWSRIVRRRSFIKGGPSSCDASVQKKDSDAAGGGE
jgi:DNA-directed RNA polymerase subunit RPC12/RpoP